jgi:2-oxoglutarate dehydrogenase E1 component
VVYPSTPASYFHVLRRQIVRPYRKPLVLFYSKSLLRHPQARSALADMESGTAFQPVLPDSVHLSYHAEPPTNDPLDDKGNADAMVKRVILCSGQVYYALNRVRQLNDPLRTTVALIRLEQLSPFPCHGVRRELLRYPAAVDLVWCQEEPMNLGMWTYVQPRLQALLEQLLPPEFGQRLTQSYAGRSPTGAVATGFKQLHHQEELAVLAEALTGDASTPVERFEQGWPIYALSQSIKRNGVCSN